MAKGVILITDEGVKLMGTVQCSNGAWFDAEGCYNYCNSSDKEINNKHQAFKLSASATILSVRKGLASEDWYKHKENFKDVNIDYEVDQSYKLNI